MRVLRIGMFAVADWKTADKAESRRLRTRMVRHIALCFVAASLWARQSVVLVNGLTGTANLPNAAPFRTADLENRSFSFQFRVHDWRPVGASYGDRFLWTTDLGQIWCGIDADNGLLCADWWDSLKDSGIRV